MGRELERKIELMQKEKTQLEVRRIEMMQFLLSIQRQIDEFIRSTTFKDIMNDREDEE